MFSPDALPVAYIHEQRELTDAARRLEEKQKEAAAQQHEAAQAHMQAHATQAPQQAATQHSPQPISAASLSQVFGRPPLSRTGSSGVIGSIFQGLLWKNPSPPSTGVPTRAQTPAVQPIMCEQERERREAEAIAQRKRDLDACADRAGPGWY